MHSRGHEVSLLRVVVYAVVLFGSAVPALVHAETRLVEQSLNTVSVDQAYFGIVGYNYPTQSFTPTTDGTVQSIAVGDNGCGGGISEFPYYAYYFRTISQVPGGWLYSGGSFPILAGHTYYLIEACNGYLAGDFKGTLTDSYAGGEAGHRKIAGPFVFDTQFASNASTGNPLLDWNFAVCSTLECSLGSLATTTATTTPPACTQNCFSNVLFLPGVEASRLYRPDISAARGEKKLWEPDTDTTAADLALFRDGTSMRSDIYTRDIIDNAYIPVKGNVYASFMGDMDALKSTGVINDWEATPYDWRLSLDQILQSGSKTGANISYLSGTTTPYIEQELRQLARTSKSGKVKD